MEAGVPAGSAAATFAGVASMDMMLVRSTRPAFFNASVYFSASAISISATFESHFAVSVP